MTLKWLIVVLVFAGDIPMDRKVFLLDPDVTKTEADCRGDLEKLRFAAKEASVDLWADCIEVKRAPPGKGAPGTEKNS